MIKFISLMKTNEIWIIPFVLQIPTFQTILKRNNEFS